MILFYQYDSLQEFKPFEPFHMTQRIEHFLEYDSKIWTCFKMTQRIEPCLKMTQRIEPWIMTQRIEFFWSNMTQRIELVLLNFDSKNWTVFCHTTQRIELFWFDLTQRIDIYLYDSQNEHFLNKTERIELFLNTTQRIEPLFFLRMTQRLELFLEYDSMDWTFFQFDSKNWTLFTKWLKELNLLEDYLTPRLKTFLTREMELLFQFGSRNWDLFSTISLKHDWPFLNMTHRIEPFLNTWFIEIEPFFSTWLENESIF